MFESKNGNVSEFTGGSTITVKKEQCETLVIHEDASQK